MPWAVQMGIGVVALLTIALDVSGWLMPHIGCLMFGKEPIGTGMEKGKSLSATRIWTLDHPAPSELLYRLSCSLVAIMCRCAIEIMWVYLSHWYMSQLYCSLGNNIKALKTVMGTVYMLHGNVVNETALFFFQNWLTICLFLHVIQVKKS
jgi:hypothetical protein